MDATILTVSEELATEPMGYLILAANKVPWAIPLLPTLGHARAVVDLARNPQYELLTCVDIAYTLPVCFQDCGGLIVNDECNVCGATNPDTGCEDDHGQIGRSMRGATHADVDKSARQAWINKGSNALDRLYRAEIFNETTETKNGDTLSDAAAIKEA